MEIFMLKAIYGTAEYESSEYLLSELKKNIKNDIKSYILVPEQFSVFTERKVIEILGVRAQTKVEVLTFSRLANTVLGSLGPLRLKYIDGAGREILASRTMQLIEKKLDYFRPNVHQQGFSGLLVGLMSEFKRYGHTPEALKTASGMIENDELRRKITDLALFYDTYCKLINQKNSDAEDNLTLILPKIKDFEMPRSACLFITEFKSFTPLERDILTELMKKLEDVHIILCCDNLNKPDDLFRTAAATYLSLCEAANGIGEKIAEPIPLTYKKQRADDLNHIIQNYFRINPEKYKNIPEHLHLIRPESYFNEIEAAAQIIHKLCRTRNYRQSDFLILARDTETYAGIMPVVFEDYGINVFLDRRRCLNENPYSRSLSAMLEILAYGFSYERVMTMARSGFCAELSDEDTDIFENYLLAVNPSHSMWNNESDWSFNPKKYDMDRINDTKHKLLSPIFKLKHSLKGRKTAAEITFAICRYIEECGHEAIIKARCREYSENGMVYLAEEYRLAWNSIVSVLNRIAEIMESTYLSYEKFYELFTAACRGIKVGVSPQTIDGTVFSKIDLFRNTGSRVVIVLGVTDGVFPRGYGSEGIISDAERQALRSYGIELAMTAEEKSFDENTLVYSVLSSASEELYLLSPKSSGDEELLPSGIITKLKNEIFDIEYEEEQHIPENRLSALRMLKTGISKLSGNTESLDGENKLIYEFFKDDTDLSAFINRVINSENGYEQLSKESVAALYGKDIMLSASKLEKFNACAFSYFMRYGLYAMPRDVAEFNPLNMGNILHASLERYFSDKKDYDDITKAQCRKEMDSIVGEIAKGADEVMYQSSAYYKYLIMRMSGIASTTAWEMIKFFKNSDFRPYGFEIKIGNNGSFPPMRIETKYGSASLEGFIDRVDSAVVDGKRYISVVDYKSSERSLDYNLAEAGVRFQPLVYTNALCNSDFAEPAAMLYQQMNDPIIKSDNANTEQKLENEIHKKVKVDGWVIDDDAALNAFDKNHSSRQPYINPKNAISVDEMKRRLKMAEDKIAQSAEGIMSGEISVNPYIKFNFNPCDYCDYSGICNTGK